MTLEWHDRAACIGKPRDWFFPPESAGPAPYALARAVCNECPVSETGLEWALENGDVYFGMFGGKVPRERQQMNRGGTYPRACGCGARFMAANPYRKYCSKVCRQRAYTDRRTGGDSLRRKAQ